MAAAPEAEEEEEVEEEKEEAAVAVLPCWVVGGGREGEANVRARKERRERGGIILYWRNGVLRPLLLVWLPKRRAKMHVRATTAPPQHTHPPPPSPPCVHELTSYFAGPEAETCP